MFTGISEELGKIAALTPEALTVKATRVLGDCKIGDSIAINGVCLTVVKFDAGSFTVDLMPETWRRTTFSQMRAGDEVNLERALAFNGRIGGHLVQGHIDGVGKIASIRAAGDEYIVRINALPEVLRYVVMKGFIAVDGISLTVTGKAESFFEISLIKHTRGITTFARRKAGDGVNLEADIIAKYVEALAGAPCKGIDASFLQEHGFLVK